MELKTRSATITTMESLPPILQEQGVELDYVLPDYYPDVCKLVKCLITPTIVSKNLNGSRLSYELRADIRILYCGEGNHILQCVTQTMHFSRSAELPAGENLSVQLRAVTDYVNCRAVSSRRLDVRGAVTIHIRPCAECQEEVLSDVPEKSMQLCRIPVTYPQERMQAEKMLILSEELELGSTKPPVLHIVRCEARPVEQSQKIVSGKLMVQGSLQVSLLYACEKDGDGSLEPMQFRIPYSQVLELDAVTEEDHCNVTVHVIACDLKPVADAGGEVRVLRCEAELHLEASALRMATESLICDAFSTSHPCICTPAELSCAGAPLPFSQVFPCDTMFPCEDGVPECVYAAWCDVKNLSSKPEEGQLVLSGMLQYNVLLRESGGMPRLMEKEEPFEHIVPMEGLGKEDCLCIHAHTDNCSYTLTGQGEIAVKAELCAEGTIRHSRKIQVLREITVQDEISHPGNYALKLYFGRAQEKIWDIAKRCHTSVEAIMEENDLTGETLTEDGMLLIPIVH